MENPTCPGCDRAVVAPRIYCCDRCKWRVKGMRRNRALGVQPRRPKGTCAAADCDRPHLARGLCSLHYRRSRAERDQRHPWIVLWASASLRGAYMPKVKRVRAKVTVGVMVACPACGDWMGAPTPTARVCCACGTTLELNPEEVSWATLEKHSTLRSTRTAS